MARLDVAVLDAQRIVLSPVGWDETVKSTVYRELPPAQWDQGKRCWVLPRTAGSIGRLAVATALLANVHDVEIRTDPASADLIAAATALTRPPDNDAVTPVRAPTEAWRHQRMAWWFMAWAREHLGAALLDCGMRTGKTRMVLDHLLGLPAEKRKALVFTPRAVVPVWEAQASRHCAPGQLRVVAPKESDSVAKRVAKAIELLSGDQPVAVILGWAVLQYIDLPQRKALRAALAGGTIVADEIHFAKAPGSIRSQALSFLGRGAEFRIGASGTPLSHSPLDAYGIFRFLDPGVFGTAYARFQDTYAITTSMTTSTGQAFQSVTAYRNLEDLAHRMRPYTFRATRDVLDLPPSTDNDIPVDMPPDAKALYREMEHEAVVELKSGMLIADNGLSKLMRLAQIASGYLPAADRSGSKEIMHRVKQAALVDLLESCDPDEPWVVFGRFKHDLESAQRAAEATGRAYFELSGERHELEDWKRAIAQASEGRRGAILGAQIQAGGIGVDMTEAAFACFLSVGYSLSEYEQARARIHGPDSKRPVAYYHILARGTVDLAIRRALAKRADVLKFVASELIRAG